MDGTVDIGTDQWGSLPAEVRSRALDAARERYRDVFEEVAGAAGPWWPMRPVVVSAAFHRELGVLCDRLAGLVLAACLRRASTAGGLLHALGVPAEEMPLLRAEEPLGEHLLVATRADVVLDRGVPTFVEINIDGAVGGTAQSDLLADRFRRLLQSVAPGLDLAVPPSALDSRFAQIRRELGDTEDPMLAIPMYEHGVLSGAATEADRVRRHRPVVEVARRFGMTAAPYPWRALTNDAENRLLADGRPVDAVLRLFVTGSEPPSAGLSALVTAVHHGTVQMHTPEASWLLSNKLVFAWLWSDLDGLDPPDQQLVRRHVPWTRVVGRPSGDAVREALADRAGWVLKPTSGHGGVGVVAGREATDDVWRDALHRAASDGGHVLQRFVAADPVDMVFVDDRTARLHAEPVPLVLGPFVFGREISNVLVRHGLPGGGHIVNAQRGACLNGLLIAPNGRSGPLPRPL